jgi:mannose-6-phosphate isomerase class I
MKQKTGAGKVLRPAPKAMNGSKNRQSPLVVSPCFMVEMFELKDLQRFRAADADSSVQILVAVDGCGIVETAGCEPVTFAKGDAVVVPACLEEFSIRPQWTLEMLKSSLPGRQVPDPEVRL